eukprot:1406835-Pleurochrysis_carterae.AAC.1
MRAHDRPHVPPPRPRGARGRGTAGGGGGHGRGVGLGAGAPSAIRTLQAAAEGRGDAAAPAGVHDTGGRVR